MRVMALVVVILLSISASALAWNEKGHMVVARLAWLKLSAEEQRVATEILKSHPHYNEYLAADRPENIAIDEWAFMRAAYWPDWVRSNHSEEFNQPTWHYVGVPFVPPQSRMKPADFRRESPNVVTQIPVCVEKVRSGTAGEKPLYLCWLLHLVGDIHQPLHCASLFSEAFPEGDRGGNLALVRIADGMPVRLHPTWDALLGDSLLLSSIDETVGELQRLEKLNADAIQRDVESHATVQDWAQEGFALAKSDVYLSGDLKPANADDHPSDDQVPSVSDAYAQNARKTARTAAIKAGRRLALHLAHVLQ